MKRFIGGASLAMLATSAFAFGTVNHFGQHAEHEKITRMALSCQFIPTASACFQTKTINAFAGADGHFGAIGLPDRPDLGFINQPSAHCDDGDYLDIKNYPQSKSDAQKHLQDCKSWMQTKFNYAIQDAAKMVDSKGKGIASQLDISNCPFDGKRSGTAKCNVLEDLGMMMHASQDFYSHTNWSDQAQSGSTTTSNPPGLKQTVPAAWISMAADNNAGFPSGLISGCYGFPEWASCTNHVKHDYLNKDEGAIDISNPPKRNIGAGDTARGKINKNFQHAVSLAVTDTVNKWNDFYRALKSKNGDTLGKREACLIVRDTICG